MTPDSFPHASSHLQRKSVRVLLRGGQALEGMIHIPEGLPLLNFLSIKRYFLNLTSVQRIRPDLSREEPFDHLSVRLSNVVWVIPLDGTLHISTASTPASSSRGVELQLVDGLMLQVNMNISEEQRMTDYLDANSGFVPFWSARVSRSQEVIERLAVNHETIMAVRELSE